MKRTVAILLALVLLLSFAVPLYAEDVASGRLILGSEVFLKAGETKTIPVEIKDAGMLSVIQFVVEYDSTKLELQNVTPTVIAGKEVNIVKEAEKGTILEGVDSQVSIAKAQISQPEAGKVSILWESENQINGDGIIAKLTFKALEDEIGRAGVSLSQDPEDEFIFKEDSQDKVPTEDIIGGVEEEPMVETKYTVSFNAGKGTGAPAAVKTIDGKVIIPDVTPVYEGHVFLGWATTSGATTAQYEHGKTYEVSSNMTLYAVWIETPKIVVGEVKGRAGETVEVPVSIENNPGISYLNLPVKYDSNVLELISMKGKGLENGSWQYGNNATFNGEDSFYNGVILTITFKIKEDASVGENIIEIKNVSANNYNEDLIEFIVEKGKVIVFDYISGDVTGDGLVDGRDLTRLHKYLADVPDTKIEIDAADVTGDGLVDGRDLTRLHKYLADVPGTELN